MVQRLPLRICRLPSRTIPAIANGCFSSPTAFFFFLVLFGLLSRQVRSSCEALRQAPRRGQLLVGRNIPRSLRHGCQRPCGCFRDDVRKGFTSIHSILGKLAVRARTNRRSDQTLLSSLSTAGCMRHWGKCTQGVVGARSRVRPITSSLKYRCGA